MDSAITHPMSMTENRQEDQVIAVVLVERDNFLDDNSDTDDNDGDDLEPTTTTTTSRRSTATNTKLRIRQSDLLHPNDNDGTHHPLTGERLYHILRSQDDDIITTTIPFETAEIYDTHQATYRSLQLPELWNCNLLEQIGSSRLRVRLYYASRRRRPQNNVKDDDSSLSSSPKLLAIEGRFYPYNGGISILNGIRIEVEEYPNEPGQGTAGNVWDGAILLTKYLEKQPELLQGKRVLELGSGCGLVGITAAVLGASQVILTDLPHALPLLQRNIDRHMPLLVSRQHNNNNSNNKNKNNSVIPEEDCRPTMVSCMACDWCHPPPKELLLPTMTMTTTTTITTQPLFHDVILVADCVWMQELVAPLLQTLKRLTEVTITTTNQEEQKHQPDSRTTSTATTTTTTVLISYQRRGKPTHEEFWAGIHSLFTHVQEIDVSGIGLTKPESLFLLHCRR